MGRVDTLRTKYSEIQFDRSAYNISRAVYFGANNGDKMDLYASPRSNDVCWILCSLNEPTLIPTKLEVFTRKSQSDGRYEISWNTDLTKGEWIGCVRRWITVPFHTDNIDGEKVV